MVKTPQIIMAPAEYSYMNLSPYYLTELQRFSADISDYISDEVVLV